MMNRSLRLVVAIAGILLWAVVAAARTRASEAEMDAGPDDPLTSILRLQQEMDRMFDAEADLFRTAPGIPLQETAPTIAVSRELSPEGPILVLKAPGLEKKSLKIDVDRRGVRLSYDARTTHEERDSARVETRGDEIRIHFRSRDEIGPRA
jgi:HSP20 family molecular chaperone IbpA